MCGTSGNLLRGVRSKAAPGLSPSTWRDCIRDSPWGFGGHPRSGVGDGIPFARRSLIEPEDYQLQCPTRKEMNMLRPALARSVLLTLLLSLPNTAQAVPILFSAGGADAASIQATVDAFRTALGPLNPNVAMSFPAGRREINWDGVPDMFSSPNA